MSKVIAGASHGTTIKYGRGCRCEPCTAAWAEYSRRYRRKRGLLSHVDRELAQVDQILSTDEVVAVPLLSVQVTPLAAQILAHLQRQTGARRGEILDRLLREHGQSLGVAA